MMWKKSFLAFLLSLSALKPAPASGNNTETNKKNNKEKTCFPEFTHPHLVSKTNVVMKGQNVSLICPNQNKLPQITYSLFWNNRHLVTQKGEPAIFNLSITGIHALGTYKCKAQVLNCSKYSHPFNFTFVDPVTTPVLNVNVVQTKTDRYITLHCISFNGSLPINYTFFEKNTSVSPVISKDVREPAEFNLTRNTGEVEEYRCEAKNRLPNHAKYSQPVPIFSTGGDGCRFCLWLLLPGLLLVLIIIILILAFWILPKHKARKAMKDKVPRDCGNTPMEAGIYANIYKNQADKESGPGLGLRPCVSTARDETGHSEEIHYATPIFQEVKPKDHEDCNDGKTAHVYSDLRIQTEI
ncbi:PREDICTED: allergin-1 isoform X1 [Hipposideros armiger]|uniref:Allergin-1 isoform X1 n=1 Tax=Hipposideros armiger TaxID=186990 RepID=A0A8B7QWW3_HIPAR|nr:PREDICTED: allergin-1 isoform X1 [Hipposideros armiger]XP_019493176.1 PREDICTED: allergin-1 isoform X1 [Hipposideros armiger]